MWRERQPLRSGFYLLVMAAILVAAAGCHHQSALVPSTPSSDNDYVDLAPGGTLRITVPYLSSGGYMANAHSVQENGGTITLSDSHLIGFQVSDYAIEGRADGRVRVKFRSAETTRDGKASPEIKPPALPFPLPRKNQHVRLIYFVRSSQADHNMAIAASKSLVALNTFTNRLRVDPGVCGKDDFVSCIWVPPGIAVRPE
jgi:hypothetical protein